jgi:hypothetical protein
MAHDLYDLAFDQRVSQATAGSPGSAIPTATPSRSGEEMTP